MLMRVCCTRPANLSQQNLPPFLQIIGDINPAGAAVIVLELELQLVHRHLEGVGQLFQGHVNDTLTKTRIELEDLEGIDHFKARELTLQG